ESRHCVRLKSHSGNLHHQRCCHARARSISADAQNSVGPKLANQAFALPDAAGQLEKRFQTGKPGNVLQRTHADEAKSETCFRNKSDLETAWGTHKQHVGVVSDLKLIRDS